MGMGRLTGRSSWRFVCNDGNDRDEGPKHGVRGRLQANHIQD